MYKNINESPYSLGPGPGQGLPAVSLPITIPHTIGRCPRAFILIHPSIPYTQARRSTTIRAKLQLVLLLNMGIPIKAKNISE